MATRTLTPLTWNGAFGNGGSVLQTDADAGFMTILRHRLDQKNLPVVALVHGVRDNVEFTEWAQAVAEQGYLVVQPNNCGSSGSHRELLKVGCDEGFGFRRQDDVNDSVDALAKHDIVDARRSCIIGWFFGG